MAYRDELEAAVARAEAAERRLANVCYLHPEELSAAVCAGCGRGVCEACVVLGDSAYCPPCFVAARSRRNRRRALVAAAAALVLGGALTGFVLLGSKGQPPDLSLDPYSGAHTRPGAPRQTYKEALAEEALKKDPCNRQAALDVAEELNGLARFGDTIERDTQFFARCGAFPRLLWTSVFAHEQRGEWAAAAADATQLIANTPSDSDFWWWRGQDRAELGQLEEAAADLRQSMALGGQHFAAYRLATVMAKLERPCDGAFALKAFWKGSPDDLDPGEVKSRISRLYVAGGCVAAQGTGKTVLKGAAGATVLFADTKIGAAGGAFAVEENAAYVTVSRAFADKAGLKVQDKPVISVYVAGEVREAHLAVAELVEIGKAAAPKVEVAVIDSLPSVDGVIGLSWLWRFRTSFDDAKGTLSISPWSD